MQHEILDISFTTVRQNPFDLILFDTNRYVLSANFNAIDEIYGDSCHEIFRFAVD